MPCFLYFWECDSGATVPGDFLPVLEGGANCVVANGTASPTVKRGVMFHDGASQGVDPERLTYRADRQTWRDAGEVKGGRLLVGMWNDWQPRESDLRRRVTVPGDAVRMGDGEMWLVPRLMFPTGETCLPQSLWVESDGVTVGKAVVKQYAALGKMGVEVLEFIRALSERGNLDNALEVAMRELELTEASLVSFAVRGIGGNYRIGMTEAGLLGLVTTQNSLDILAALVGLGVKKNDTSGGLQDSGGAG